MKKFCLLVIVVVAFIFLATKANNEADKQIKLLTNEEMLDFVEELAFFFDDKEMLDETSAIKAGIKSRVDEKSLNKIEMWKLILPMAYYLRSMNTEEKQKFVESLLNNPKFPRQAIDREIIL